MSDASNQGDRFLKLDGDMNDSGALALNPLCGVQDGGSVACVPDERNACSGYTPPAQGMGGQSGAAGESAQGGAGNASSGTGGVDASIGSGGAGTANESGAAGEVSAGEGGMSATMDAGVDAGIPPYGCQVTLQGGMPVAACAASGRGTVDAPCQNSGDCQAGLVCVQNSTIPQCRPFCCQGDTHCGPGTYCAERPLRDDRAPDAGASAMVPACVPATDCDLATPYPCPAGAECVCKGDTACMVVRSGTTACVVPGMGQELEPCPCAFGYVCSADSQLCLRLCLVDGEQSCGVGLCQSVAGLPQGWGVCIADSKPG